MPGEQARGRGACELACRTDGGSTQPSRQPDSSTPIHLHTPTSPPPHRSAGLMGA